MNILCAKNLEKVLNLVVIDPMESNTLHCRVDGKFVPFFVLVELVLSSVK